MQKACAPASGRHMVIVVMGLAHGAWWGLQEQIHKSFGHILFLWDRFFPNPSFSETGIYRDSLQCRNYHRLRSHPLKCLSWPSSGTE